MITSSWGHMLLRFLSELEDQVLLLEILTFEGSVPRSEDSEEILMTSDRLKNCAVRLYALMKRTKEWEKILHKKDSGAIV